MLQEKALFTQAPATHPWPAPEGPPPMVISGRQQTRFGKLHSANLNFARGTYLSPNAFWLRKATLA